MSQRPIPLDYKSPQTPPSPPGRKTSVITWFACGVGLGFLGLCIAGANEEDIPIGPACSGVIFVVVASGAFAFAGWVREKFFRSILVERNRFLTVFCGVFVLTSLAAMLFHNPDTAAMVFMGSCITLSFAANWIALRARPVGGEVR